MKYLVIVASAALLVAGCASKNFVQEQVSGAESRQAAKVAEVSSKADENSAEIAKLQNLQMELSKRTDLALNKVSGFENYKVLWEGEVNFAFDSYELDPSALQVLGEAGEKMNSEPRSIVEISGFTDQVGSRDYNYILGEKRAESAKRYLFEKYGVGLFRTFTVSWGKDHATAGSTDNTRTGSKNRRVALKVWGPITNTADAAPAN